MNPVLQRPTACGIAGPPRDSLDALVEHARVILRGRVVERAPGLAGMRAGLILAVEVDRVLAGGIDVNEHGVFYLSYPAARFELADVPIWSGLSGFSNRFVEEPWEQVAGSEVFLFLSQPPAGDEIEVHVLLDPREAMFQLPDSEMTIGSRLFDRDEVLELGSFDALEALILGKLERDPAAHAFDQAACMPAALQGLDLFANMPDLFPDLDRGSLRRALQTGGTRTLYLDFAPQKSLRVSDLGHAVEFDINGDGVPELMGWPFGNQGIPWLDRNGNGRPDDGRELFTEHATRLSGLESSSPFELLRTFDDPSHGGDGDGRITAADAVWQELRIWVDWHRDAVFEPEEDFRPEDFCLASISLDAEEGPGLDGMPSYTWHERHRASRRERQADAGDGV